MLRFFILYVSLIVKQIEIFCFIKLFKRWIKSKFCFTSFFLTPCRNFVFFSYFIIIFKLLFLFLFFSSSEMVKQSAGLYLKRYVLNLRIDFLHCAFQWEYFICDPFNSKYGAPKWPKF
ncbi:hypothetical protein DRI50_08845 [candidate division KSB1 bacterium]|nr:MAG: hypothetical protein DRI50_08845 [candidate division KSB1 bacterium]